MPLLDDHVTGCTVCRTAPAPPAITMAFQPIVDAARGRVWAHEALVRGTDGSSAWSVLEQIDEHNRFRFDQLCRVRAIEQASRLELANDTLLSINFLPNAIYEPSACIRTTITAASTFGVAQEQLVFELTEVEQVQDIERLRAIVDEYRAHGFRTAIDDFGAGYNGLNLLADFRPDIVKIDMHLVRDIDSDPVRRRIVAHVAQLCAELDIDVVAEGIETRDEALALLDLGVGLHQGYWYARPAFDALAEVTADRYAVSTASAPR